MRYPSFAGWLIAMLLSGFASLTYGQTTAVLTGYVTEAATGNPMPFANVYINGSTRGTTTDEKGYYKLTGVPLGTVEIAASFVGYKSATQKVRFDNTVPQQVSFRLEVSEQTLDAVTVRGNPKLWERHLRQFKKQLFGEPFGSQCELVNSGALQFKEEKSHLYATASEPLIIENQATGYRVIYALQHFDVTTAGELFLAGTARFEELKPENEREAGRYRRNRLMAYKGSIRHLMASLIDNTWEQAGFQVYQEDVTKPMPLEGRTITLYAAVNDIKRLVPVKAQAMIQPGRLPTERRLVSPMKLIVFYTKATSGFSPYPDARYAYTEMKLPAGQLQMTVDGVITMPEGMEAKGSMGNDRISTMLPADWKPEGPDTEKASEPAQGGFAPPDARMEGIVGAFTEQFGELAPSLFVHIDKSFYATGDRLWMSTYVLDAATHRRTAGETAIHVDLLTPAGKPVQHQWIRTVDGRGEGSFRLSDTLMTGMYRLRAYTDSDENQRRPAFERLVAVYNLIRNSPATPKDAAADSLDIQVLPEGGRWISGLPARLGVKIVPPDGHGVSVEGRIVDDQGQEMVRFKTNPQGMTSVTMVPKADRTYYAEVTYTNQRQQVQLPATETEGLLLSADVLRDTTQLALTITSAARAATDTAYLLIQQHNRITDQRKVLLSNGVAKVSMPMMSWLPGLARITLYDGRGRPQAERLIFVPAFTPPVRLTMEFTKKRYQPREQVTLSVQLNDNGSPVPAALSSSITDAGRVPADTAEATLLAHLLLTGELRGRVRNPDRYVGNSSPETRKALDDLLLTQGWRRVSGVPEPESAGGLSLAGQVLHAKTGPLPNAQLVIASTTPRQSFVKTMVADENGRFRLTGLTIKDTVQLMVQVSDQKSRKLTAKEVQLVSEVPGKNWETGKPVSVPSWTAWQAQLEAARTRQQADVGFYRDNTIKMLAEVTVRERKTEERPEDVQMRSLHNVADAVLVFTDKSPRYSNVYEMIQGRLAGVSVTRLSPPPGQDAKRGYRVSVRGAGSFNAGNQPLFLVDGVPVEDPDGTGLMAINSSDIERVEVLKSAGTTGMYGARGANGVIAFYTKNKRSSQVNVKLEEYMKPVPFIGYASVQREFYVPKYDTEAVSGPVDHRDVLYWKPMMQTDNQGRSQLRFPLSDVVRTLRVVIQGVTADGRPVLGMQLVQVQ